MTKSAKEVRTKKVEETAHVEDAENLSAWVNSVLHEFEKELASYPEVVTISVEWEQMEDGDE